MRPTVVLILQPPPTAAPGTPVGWLETARATVTERHRVAFEELGETEVQVVSQPPDGRSFGERLRGLVADVTSEQPRRQTGLIVLGGGAMPLARRDDLELFIAATRVRSRRALANSYYSADAVALPDARFLVDVPDLPSDNALPRWLTERAGIPVADLRDRTRLQVDLDSPVDVLLAARDPGCPAALRGIAADIAAAHPAAAAALDRVVAVLLDRRAELLVAGRMSSRTLRWLERNAACRARALVEERGLRARSTLALGDADTNDEPADERDATRPRADVRLRPPRSVLGLAIDAAGPERFGDLLAELGDAAIIDTRVLLAHRLGADESAWPPLADRLASDLLAPGRIADPWLRALTASAGSAGIPILLGGHTLVGPGLPLLGRGA